jgi:hypothetical protein
MKWKRCDFGLRQITFCERIGGNMRNKRTWRLLSAVGLFVIGLVLAAVPPMAISKAKQSAAQTTESVPAFHAQPPQGELPATMDPGLFSAQPVVQNAYTVAAKIRKTLYQQPCYCHCDKSQGHGSLLDCFASRHGSGCSTCIYEDLYAYEQVRKGKTAAQIRAGIIKGEWQTMDASKYQQPLPAK